MTRRQANCICDAIGKLQEARKLLDVAMYYSEEPLADSEQKKVREAYDLICDSIDRL